MPSPFPGMNPYLEQGQHWPQFHKQFCTRCLELLVPQVRPAFFVKLEEHVYIHELTENERVFMGIPDVAIGESVPSGPPRTSGASAAVLDTPVRVRVPVTTFVERFPYLVIRDRQDRSIVTVLELLSPTNKRIGEDRNSFVSKRRELFATGVHYVEIDLLRGGARMQLERMPSCDYYVLVSRAEERPEMDMWPLRVRERLPEVPIPLRDPHPDARIDLQAVLHYVYDAAGYADYLYSGHPEPRLHPDDEAWAKQLLATAKT